MVNGIEKCGICGLESLIRKGSSEIDFSFLLVCEPLNEVPAFRSFQSGAGQVS